MAKYNVGDVFQLYEGSDHVGNVEIEYATLKDSKGNNYYLVRNSNTFNDVTDYDLLDERELDEMNNTDWEFCSWKYVSVDC
jgi:hypothetical protein